MTIEIPYVLLVKFVVAIKFDNVQSKYMRRWIIKASKSFKETKIYSR